MAVNWITYKNRQILFADYSSTKTEDEMLAILHEAIEMERNSKEKVYLLANFENVKTSNKFLDELKALSKEVAVGKVEKTAVLGISGVKKTFLSVYNVATRDKTTKVFDTEAEAKDWLAS